MAEELKILEEIRDKISALRSIISPIIPSALATLDGWTWKVNQNTERILLTRGAGPTNLFPTIQNERGWLDTLGVVFSDPYSELRFSCDNWVFQVSPFFVNTFGMIQANSSTVYLTVYNPATPLGPLYGFSWNPSQFWPYKTQVMFQVLHPSTALTPTSQVVLAGIGRHYIRDDKQFYESIFLDAQRQTIGRVEVPIRRSK